MQVRATLAPGQNSTKQLLKAYGDQLVHIRYRYDKTRQRRLKTVELMVDEQDWAPEVAIPADQRVPIRMNDGETEFREKIRNAFGYRNPKFKAWIPTHHTVLQMGHERRIVNRKLSS